jgi:hypothetical protein
MRRCVAAAVLAASALFPAGANAQGSPGAATPTAASAKPPALAAEARADTLFNAAKQLQDGGQLAEACPMFAESKRLAPGVGVTLHLGDCYERMGRTASAWAQYREAETMARAKHDDKRAGLAHDRAQALEPKVGRLTMSASSAPHAGWQVQLDGTPVPPEMWNTAIAVDPIDHTVTVTAPGKPTRTLNVHLAAGNLAATVSLEESEAASPSAAAAATGSTFAAATAASEAGSAEAASSGASSDSTAPSSSSSRAAVTRTWAELGLAGLGAVGIGLGTVFLVKKNESMYNGNACDGPTEDKQAAAASAISFSVGAVALASAVVLYLTTPGHTSQMGVTIAPAVSWGGGGALLRTTF